MGGSWGRKGLVAFAAAALAIGVAPAGATDQDEVSPAEDNPPGCETAAFSGEQCGAQGRNGFYESTHKPPIEACKSTAPTGSVVTRVLPSGPRRADGSLAFVSGVCVYLPPGYASGALRYPVLYLLHGGGGDQGNWVTAGGVQKLMDDAYAADPSHATIVVMPDGNNGNWHDYIDGEFMIEQYVLRHVVPYIDRRYRTLPFKAGRAIVGLSNGGYGALLLASKAPDMFVAAGAMSSNVAARAMDGLGTPWAPGVPNSPTGQEAGAFYYGNAPASLAANLDDVDVTMDLGASCSEDVAVDLCARLSLDLAFKYDNEAFRDAMLAAKHVGAFEFRETEGAHAWKWWTLWLRERHLPFVWQRLARPQPANAVVRATPVPASFRYRSIAPAFDIYGYHVSVDRTHPEFLELGDVSTKSLTVTGTGNAQIYTAPRYEPDTTYRVTGTGRPEATQQSDNFGRLLIGVNLGPAHADEQYSAAARAQEAAGQYRFLTRTVTITRVAGAAISPSTPPQVEVLARTGGTETWPGLAAVMLSIAFVAQYLRTKRCEPHPH